MNKIILTIFILSFILLPAVNASAISLNLTYPSFGGFNLADDQSLNQIVAWFYYLIISISGISAFVMIVWGGVEWLSSAGNPGTIGSAKDKIQSALIGLVIVLGSYLILQVINPDLLKLKDPSFDVLPGTNSKDISLIDQVALNPDANTNPAFDVFLPPGTYSGAEARSILLAVEGISIVSSGNCIIQTQSACTSLQGIPKSTVQDIIELKSAITKTEGWALNLVITGGTEVGHQTHGPGLPVVDIRYNPNFIKTLNSWVKDGKLTYICENGSTKVDSCSNADHFHVVFK